MVEIMAKKKPFLKKLAEEILGEDLASKLWKRIEIIGDIAVIRVPFDLSPETLKPLAEAILSSLPYVKSVWAGLPGVHGDYRLRKYIHLAGEERSETVYKEHGCLFKIDITRVYISPRLNYEHKRVAKLVRQGEIITNMFAGAGLFSIIIAKHSNPEKVYSIDINPVAYKYMVENIRLNHVEDKVVALQGDAAKVIEKYLVGTSNRVLMPLPELALEYLPYAIKALKKNRGIIHVYLHVVANKGENYLDKAEVILDKRFKELGVAWKPLFKRRVRNVGPRKYQVVVDAFVNP